MKDHKEIDPDATAMLVEYNWPGNVRELQNIIERIMITTKGRVIRPENLPGFIRNSIAEGRMAAGSAAPAPLSQVTLLNDILDHAEKAAILAAMEGCGTTRELARRIGVSQPTAVRKLHKHGLSFSQKTTSFPLSPEDSPPDTILNL
jgi:DNA-binding NtrC family response regulator